MVEGEQNAMQAAIHDFESGPDLIVDGKKCPIAERFKKHEARMQEIIDRFPEVARWLWPSHTKSISGWASIPLEDFMYNMRYYRRRLSGEALDLGDLGSLQRWMNECVAYSDKIGRRFRDSATHEAVWATASFALGALIVGLFALWLQC
jgi:hypothetical protein